MNITVAYFKVYNLRALGHLGLFGLGLNKLTFLKGKGFVDFTGTYIQGPVVKSDSFCNEINK